MRILVIGLDAAVPELLFGDERLTNIRRMMEMGCHGRLESIVPPITVPAWMCMSCSQDPGSLGVYGFRNRRDHSYDGLSIVNAKSMQELSIWDQVAREGNRSVIIGVPPSFPPRKVNGICVGCFLTPDTNTDNYTHPAAVRDQIKGRLEATVDDHGRHLGAHVFRPQEIYRHVRNVAPDLIVHFGGLYWRSVGSVGHRAIHVQENDTGPDDCNHSQFGSFILAGSGVPLQGELSGVRLLDVAPTLLELGGYDIPNSMQGRSLASGLMNGMGEIPIPASAEEIIRERLSGLGYIS